MSYAVDDFSRAIPGDVFFTQVSLPGKATIEMGQLLIGDSNRYHHVGIAVDGGLIAEARPPKAQVVLVDPKHHSLWFRLPLNDLQRKEICLNIRDDFRFGDIKYGWSNYGYLGLMRLGIRPGWLRNQIANSRRRICSQFVDDHLTRVGYSVLEGVLPGQVTPGDLEYRFAHDPEITAFRLDGQPSWYWNDRK